METKATEKIKAIEPILKSIDTSHSLRQLQTVYGKVKSYSNRLDTMSITVNAFFWMRVKDVVTALKEGGKKVSQEGIAEHFGVKQSYVSKIFTAVNEENYLVNVTAGKIDLQGKSRLVDNKESKARHGKGIVERAKDLINKLSKLLHKAELEEKTAIREYGKGLIPSIFETMSERKTDKTGKVIKPMTVKKVKTAAVIIPATVPIESTIDNITL
jgi:transcription initiation factor IIE alpha subunit